MYHAYLSIEIFIHTAIHNGKLFLSGVTHKKPIIEYCENKIRHAIYNKDIVDADSYILMWELLILLIRQNGVSIRYYKTPIVPVHIIAF